MNFYAVVHAIVRGIHQSREEFLAFSTGGGTSNVLLPPPKFNVKNIMMKIIVSYYLTSVGYEPTNVEKPPENFDSYGCLQEVAHLWKRAWKCLPHSFRGCCSLWNDIRDSLRGELRSSLHTG